METLLHSVSQHITHAAVWWHMPLYVLRPCGKVTWSLSLCTAMFSPVPAHSVGFCFYKNNPQHENIPAVIRSLLYLCGLLATPAKVCFMTLVLKIYHWAVPSATVRTRVGGYEILLFPYLLDERSGCEMDHSEEPIRKADTERAFFCDHTHTTVSTGPLYVK